MGRSVICAYRLEFTDGTGRADMVSAHDRKPVRVMGWNSKNGTATNANLMKYMVAYGRSLESGGVNEHVSKMLKLIPYPTWARLIAQKGPRAGTIVAEWKPGPFVAW